MKKLAEKIKIRVCEKLYLLDPDESALSRSIVKEGIILIVIRWALNLSLSESWLSE